MGTREVRFRTLRLIITFYSRQMSKTLNCIFDAFDKCPNTAAKMEAMMKEMSDKQRQSGEGPYMPSYEETKAYIKNECPSLPGKYPS